VEKKLKEDSLCILVIDDSQSDLGLIERAIQSSEADAKVFLLDNGIETISYLMGEGEFSNRNQYPYPSMIITILNMPVIDGFDILEHLRNNPSWSIIPTIILSSSQYPDDIRTSYMLGASAYHVKPYSFSAFENTIKMIIEYWSLVEKPIRNKLGQLETTEAEGKHGERFKKPRQIDQSRTINQPSFSD
jgi:CheY-like chemotaxis protein